MSRSQFHIHSRAYLGRALSRLSEQTTEGLFYAALELRCGIEARIDEYAAANKYVSLKKAKNWKVVPKFKELERVSSANVKCAYIGLKMPGELENKHLYFTPVSADLTSYVKRLGNCLHAQTAPPDAMQLREWMETIAHELRVACSGTLLTPPLMTSEKSPKIEMNVEFRTESEAQEWYAAIKDFDNINVHVEYLDSPPEYYLRLMDEMLSH